MLEPQRSSFLAILFAEVSPVLRKVLSKYLLSKLNVIFMEKLLKVKCGSEFKEHSGE